MTVAMETAKELITAQLLQGEGLKPVPPEMFKLDRYRMTSQTEVPNEEFMLNFFDKHCFPRKELTTISGPAKGGKTFFTSMVMACCIRQEVLALERLTKEPLRVLWYDTEQSRNTTKEIMVGRIGKLILPTRPEGSTPPTEQPSFPDEQFFVFNVRTASIKERREMIGMAVDEFKPDIVILDGISDLLTDINDGPKATELIEELLQLANEQKCNVTTVIHLNRTGDKSNLRGWLGTVLLQKSYEVFNCTQLSQSETLCVEHSVSRKSRSLQKLYYEVDDEGIPFKAKAPVPQRDSQGRWTANSEDEQPGNGALGTLNRDYIIEHDDQTGKPWEWDLRRLFTDAMGNLPYMGSEQLEQAVMQLSHIRQKQYYYKVLAEAERRGVVRKTYDRYKRVVCVLSPPG